MPEQTPDIIVQPATWMARRALRLHLTIEQYIDACLGLSNLLSDEQIIQTMWYTQDLQYVRPTPPQEDTDATDSRAGA